MNTETFTENVFNEEVTDLETRLFDTVREYIELTGATVDQVTTMLRKNI